MHMQAAANDTQYCKGVTPVMNVSRCIMGNLQVRFPEYSFFFLDLPHVLTLLECTLTYACTCRSMDMAPEHLLGWHDEGQVQSRAHGPVFAAIMHHPEALQHLCDEQVDLTDPHLRTEFLQVGHRWQ